MFRRFRPKEELHDIWLNPKFVKSESEGIWRWYCYNMVNDDEAMKEVQRRADRCWLGLERTIQDLQGISEIPEEDMKILFDRLTDEGDRG
jgi:hypothetical protein